MLFVISIALSMTATAEIQPDTVAAIGPPAPSAPVPDATIVDDPLTAAISEAKEAGDVDLVLALEAQRPSPEVQAGPEIGTEARTRTAPSYGGVGDPTKTAPPSADQPEWWFDIDITGENVDNRERHPGIATASNGDMYVVFEETFSGNRYVQVYRSLDGGTTWTAFGFVTAAGVDLVEPTIAIGEGSTGDLVLIAYIKDDGTNEREVEVATHSLAGSPGAFSVITVPDQPLLWDYSKPVIWTDSHSYGAWYIYLIAEAIFDGTSTNRNVSFWRSINGTSFEAANHIWGNLDTDTWMDPDGTFGTSGRDVFVTVFNDTNDTLYSMQSLDLGASFEAQVTAYAFPADQIPSYPVDPDIEAAINGNNIIIACTKSFSGNDNPGYTESSDNGATWSYLFSMDGYSSLDEFAVALNANEGGQSFHIAWTDGDYYIHGNSRPQDLSAFFSDTPPVVNDTDYASASYPVKGITSNWTSDMERVVWADWRRSPEYSIFYDEDFFIIIITWIFSDDFESGGLSNWSSVVP